MSSYRVQDPAPGQPGFVNVFAPDGSYAAIDTAAIAASVAAAIDIGCTAALETALTEYAADNGDPV